jgi:sporulation integral membrane protein YlbJ
MGKRSFWTVVMAALASGMTLALVLYPDVSMNAALAGMKLFFDVVFPSLFPFFVLSEVMLGLGVVNFIGVLFEPLMRPVFNVPGEGAFVLSMGLAAGYPMDAVITSRFRKQGLCTRVEGERLLAFSNTADPLFIFGAVAVGMFHSAALGATMALAHYLGALGVGLLFRFYGARQPGSTAARAEVRRGNILARAVGALIKARHEDGRPFGQILGEAVTESVKTLLMICGFIMLFSTFVKIIDVVGLGQIIAWPFAMLFQAVGIDPDLVSAAVAGLLEIDLGTLAASQADAPLVQQVLVAGAIIAWSGLSVHAQVASVLTGSDIRMGAYALARLLHGVLAAIFTVMLMEPAGQAAIGWLLPGLSTMPVLAPMAVGAGSGGFLGYLGHGVLWALAAPLGLAVLGAVLSAVRGGIRIIRWRVG